MIETKLIEVRDRATFIPALAIAIRTDSPAGAEWLAWRAGYGPGYLGVILIHLNTTETHNDPHDWGMARTMRVVHQHLLDNWFRVHAGDVLDVEYLLGETKEPKRSEKDDELPGLIG